MNNVIVVIGAGSIGQAIARRVSAGKRVLIADLRRENADAAADVLSNTGFDVRTTAVDVSSRDFVRALVETATAIGDVAGDGRAARDQDHAARVGVIVFGQDALCRRGR